jgi:hypothetical protein
VLLLIGGITTSGIARSAEKEYRKLTHAQNTIFRSLRHKHITKEYNDIYRRVGAYSKDTYSPERNYFPDGKRWNKRFYNSKRN